jgi:GT2 family glycosyltransferase
VPDITVVVPSHERRDWLRRCLTAIADLPERPAVVVVDNGSNDGTAGMVAHEFPQVRMLRRQPNPTWEAFNAGVAAASTPIVALAEVDSGWVPGSLERGVKLMREYNRLAVIAARTLVGPKRVTDPMSEHLSSASRGVENDLPGPSVQGFRSSSAILRRDAFLAVGGFDPAARATGPERRLAYDLARAGWGLAYCQDIVCTSERIQQVSFSPQETVMRRRTRVKSRWAAGQGAPPSQW